MQKAIFLSLMLMFIASAAVYGQNPVPEPDTISNPVQQGDPAVRQLPPRLDYVEDRQKITPEEIPTPVRQTLDGSAQYTEWQKAMIYHDKNKDEYVIEFVEAGKTTTYRFNKEGKPIIEE